jgi:F-type H+-transporting ATPase subunit b
MISINATLVLQVVHFLLLAFILNRLMFRPILRTLNKRTQYFQETRTEIEKLEKEAQRLKSEYFENEKLARKEAVRERTEIRNKGLSEVEKMLTESREQVASIRAEADQNARREMKNLRPSVQQEAGQLADEIMEQVIGRRAAV